VRSRLAAAVVAAVLATATAPASARAQSVTGGVSLGANLSEINVSGNEGLNVLFTDKFEPTFGGFVSFALDANSTMAIECDGLYSVKGSLLDINHQQQRFRLTYLDAPVMFRYVGDLGHGATLHFIAGSYVSVLMSASRSGPTSKVDVRDAFRPFDIGWVAGFGVGLSGVRFDVRYSGGVIDIAEDPIVPSASPPPTAYRNRGFTLLGSWEF